MKNPDTKELLRKHFGHDSLRPGQAEVIDRVLDGTNTLAVLPTGGGKSLCYQYPAVVLDGLTIVVSPLIALMRDQVDVLVRRGVAAARIDSSVDEITRLDLLEQLEIGAIKILYLSPEKLTEPAMMMRLKKLSVSLVAIDEAHCISEWGHSFRPSYLRIPRLVKSLKPRSILALTATASPKTATGIRKAFSILKRDQVQTSFYRENLHFDVSVCSEEEKKSRTLDVLSQSGRTPAIVYATRRGDVEELAAFLNEHGVNARAYHAGMPADARAEVQDGFVAHRFDVICATIAFGMGVDMPDVRSVIHYHPPKSPEGWIQESGRAGRDGLPSHCEVLLNGDDRAVLEGMIQAKQPGKPAVRAILQNVFSQGPRAIISRYNLSTLNDVPIELLDILLARLETSGWITQEGASWMWCHLVPLRWDQSARERLMKGFPKQQQEMFSEMLESRQRISLFEMSGNDVTKMNKLVGQLRELEAGGEVRLKMSHSLTHYRISKEPQNLNELADEMLEVFQDHARNDIERIDSVFKMALSRRCLAVSLVGYFGEKLTKPCGHCASCLGKSRPRKLPLSSTREVTMDELEIIQRLVAEKRAPLSSPQRLARFLCGIYSPAMMRYRLYQHNHWGMLARHSFDDVETITRSVI
ncbi:ATP-dependent DNA helicase RecQ [Oceaniferula spumae]|uniref:ATP-dependent DNA helicase RecQ n=1 Tax=Oceaniferula spumae TaxID=2979115 RepID=A0AAT9FL30_9BACT